MNNNSYYEAPYDDQADHEEMQERIDYELKNANYPYSEENINEAIFDEALNKHFSTLATLLAKGQLEEAGLVLSSALYTYWEDRTTREVEENF
jgi:hypothetical protein